MGLGSGDLGVRAQGFDILGKASLGFRDSASALMLSGLQFMVLGVTVGLRA